MADADPTAAAAATLRLLVRDIPDFPKPGIVFKDITPLFLDAARARPLRDPLDRRVERMRVQQQRRDVLEDDPRLREAADVPYVGAEVNQ